MVRRVCVPVFLLQCSLVFELLLLTYPSDKAKNTFIVNLFSRRTAQWATAVLENRAPTSSSLSGLHGYIKADV